MAGPNFMSGFFGGGGGGNGNGQQQQENQELDEDDIVEEEQEPNVRTALADIFDPGEPDSDDEDEDADDEPKLGPDGKPLPTQEQQLAADIQRMIAGINVAEEDMPADFDINNPKHVRDLLGKTQQKAAMATVQMVMRPMQVAMEQFSRDIRQHVTQELSGFGGRQQERTTLESIVPEASDPQLKPMVDMLFNQAKQKKGITPQQAAQAVRKGLDAMGIKSKTKDDDAFSGGFKTGDSALDMFAPLKPQKTSNQQVRRPQGK